MLNHIAIIPDGNRRYSKKHNIPLEQSYQKGIDQVFKISNLFFNVNVEEISIFGFSKENWKREESNINLLHNLFFKNGKRFLKERNKNVKINFIGNLSKFKKELVNLFEKIQELTSKNDKILNICLNYSGRDEIIQAAKFKSIQDNLWIKNDIDLLIRTGGYHRISGFCIWQISYSEIYFEKKLWSELTENDVKRIFNWFNNQKRNFGT